MPLGCTEQRGFLLHSVVKQTSFFQYIQITLSNKQLTKEPHLQSTFYPANCFLLQLHTNTAAVIFHFMIPVHSTFCRSHCFYCCYNHCNLVNLIISYTSNDFFFRKLLETRKKSLKLFIMCMNCQTKKQLPEQVRQTYLFAG